MLRLAQRLAGASQFAPAPSLLSPLLVCQHVAHELRLQLLGASFSTDRENTFQSRQLFVPGREMHHGNLIILDRTPHDPPVIARAFHHAAIGTSATVKR